MYSTYIQPGPAMAQALGWVPLPVLIWIKRVQSTAPRHGHPWGILMAGAVQAGHADTGTMNLPPATRIVPRKIRNPRSQ
jgi:hypothetical protein